MMNDLSDTQPTRPGGDTRPNRALDTTRQAASTQKAWRSDPHAATQGLPSPQPETGPASKPPRRLLRLALAGLLVLALLGMFAAGGALAGYQSGQQARSTWEVEQARLSLQEQHDLAVQDMEAGRYDLAYQRLEYILKQDPNFPGAAEKLAAVIAVLYATATPTNPPPPTATITLTPTRDLRPIQQIFDQAVAALQAQDWTAVIDTLNSLRKEDPQYEMARVDGMLYIALRNRGVDKITNQRDLQGGSYDLALAERFAPLDGEADRLRNLARLFMYGNAFWEAYPEQAVYYFSQVAAAAPYMVDGSGWTAMERYRGALIQYGDALIKEERWCEAEEQYLLAQSIRSDSSLEEALYEASIQCHPPTETPAPTVDFTPTLTPTLTASSTPTITLPPATTTAPTVQPTTPVAPTPTDTPPVVSPEPPTETPPPPPPTETTPPPTDPPPATETPPPPTEPPPATEPPPPTETAPPPVDTEPPASETPSPLVTDTFGETGGDGDEPLPFTGASE